MQTKAGLLPPLEERLPKNPMLIRPVERNGDYGGVWRMAMLGAYDVDILYRTIDYEPLVRWDAAWSRIVPNVAESVEVAQDGKSYTFRLRQGLRWSDGIPFTAEDVLFWYQAEFNPNARHPLGGDLKIEKLGPHVVRFCLNKPNGLFLHYMASAQGNAITSLPKHYLSRFHPSGNPNADAEAKAAGWNNWQDRMQAESYMFSPTRFVRGKPTLSAWIMTNSPPGKPYEALDTIRPFVAVRNPYYWKIDPAGCQLPYLDRVEFRCASSIDAIRNLAAEGSLDMQYFFIAGEECRSFFETRQKIGNYRLFKRPLSVSSAVAVSLNITHENPEIRRLFSNRDFRAALSMAIDRREIISELGLGLQEPYQVAPRPESPFYHERLAKQYTQHDPAEASRLLDTVGCKQRGIDGFRLRPDGQPLILRLSLCDNPYYNALWSQCADYIVRAWRKAGVNASVQKLSRSELYGMKNNNRHDAVIWEGEGGADPLMEPRYYVPMNWESNYAERWYGWWIGDLDKTSAPPEIVQQQLKLYEGLRLEQDLNGQRKVMGQILDIAADQFYVMGIALQGPGYGIVRNDFRNVPSIIPGAWSYPSPAPANPCQFFTQKNAAHAN